MTILWAETLREHQAYLKAVIAVTMWAAAVGIPVELADGLVSVAYAFVEAMAKVRDKANTRNAAEA